MTGALGQIEIDEPKEKMPEWKERMYIADELKKRHIEPKTFWKR